VGDAPTKRTRRWERRREQILEAAEEIFGRKGLAGARLEDVAQRLELRRPSLVYYFGDKDALYDAVFARILDALWTRIEAAREGSDPLERMEAVASAWVDYLRDRPFAARILLRQIADEVPARGDAVQARLAEILAGVRDEIDAGVESGSFKPVDAAIYATAIAGASMFWVAARPAVERSLGFDPLAPEPLEGFREMLVGLTRQLLGAGGGRPTARVRGAPAQRPSRSSRRAGRGGNTGSRS